MTTISVIAPCRNEVDFVDGFIQSIDAQSISKEGLECIIVDGISDDGTLERLEELKLTTPYLRVLKNEKKTTPNALNTAIKHAKGDIIIRLDIHSTYDTHYIENCIKHSQESGADNVGGVISLKARNNTMMGQAIQVLMTSRVGVGGASYRSSKDIMGKEVDTVPFGCFPKETFEKYGLFNEHLDRNQDYELNKRIREKGGKIRLFSDIKATYYCRSKLSEHLKQMFKTGFWVIYMMKWVKGAFAIRHLMPLIFLGFLLSFGFCYLLGPVYGMIWGIGFGLYLSIIIAEGVLSAIKKNNPVFIVLVPMTFVLTHIAYGVGSLWGAIRVCLGPKKT